MAAHKAKGGFGTKLFRDDGTGTFVAVADCKDFNGPTLGSVIEDATHMESPNGWEEKVHVGLKNAGDLTFQMHLVQDDATQNPLYLDQAAGTLSNYRLVFPSGTKRLAFTAYVANIGHTFPVKGVMMNDVTLSISGKVSKETHP